MEKKINDKGEEVQIVVGNVVNSIDAFAKEVGAYYEGS